MDSLLSFSSHDSSGIHWISTSKAISERRFVLFDHSSRPEPSSIHAVGSPFCLIKTSSRVMVVINRLHWKLVVFHLVVFQDYIVEWVFLLNNGLRDAYCTGPCRQFTVTAGEWRHYGLRLSFVMNIKLQEILEKCNKEEREVIERWFKNFQAIELSKLNGISIARGASTTCPLY